MKKLMSKTKISVIVIINHLILIGGIILITKFWIIPFGEKFHSSSAMIISMLVLSLISVIYIKSTTKYINDRYANYDDEFFLAFNDSYLDYLFKAILAFVISAGSAIFLYVL